MLRRYANDRFGAMLFILAVGILVLAIGLYALLFGAQPWDSLAYLAAGERLNAGHQLYALGPGDRTILASQLAAGSSAPLISPPLVAVLWRPLAMLPEPFGVAGWWVGMCLALAVTLAAVLRARPLVAGVVAILAIVPLMWQLTMGNVNALLIAATVGAWWLVGDHRGGLAGIAIGAMLVLKVVALPVAVWVWFVAGRPGRMGLIVGTAAVAVLSLAGAGLQAHFDYLRVASEASAGVTRWSPAGLLGLTGIAAFIPWAILFAGSVAIVMLRARPGAAYMVAVVTMVFGFGAVNMHTYALLVALAAPFAWPPGDSPFRASWSFRAEASA